MDRHCWTQRSSRGSRSFSDPLLSAALTAAVLWAVLRLDAFVPFGVNTPAVTDAKLQYLDLFAYYRDVLTGQNSAVYTFSNTLGGGMAAIWAYYLASPFNLLVLLFPKEQMNLFLEVLITAKLSAASASFAWFIGRRFRGRICREITLVLSVGYGLMQYTLAQGSNVMWLDGVILLPFIVLGIHRAVRGERCAGLALAAAASVLANWYTGGINYLFSIVWFLYEAVRRSGGAGEKREGRRFLGALGRYLLAMGLGLLLAAVLFVPNVLMLRAGKGAGWNPAAYGLSAGLRGNPLSIFRSYRIGEQSDISRVSFFCGTPALFGTAAFFISGRIRSREKAAAAGVFLTAWMACFWQPLFYVFSLFMKNTSYWYRFGYLGSFVLLYLAAYWAGSLPQEGGFRNAGQWSVIPGAGGLCLALILLSQKIWPSGGNGSTRIAVFMTVSVTILLGIRWAPENFRGVPVLEYLWETPQKRSRESRRRERRRKKVLAVLLAVLCLAESFLQARAILRIYHTDTAGEYASYSGGQQAQIREIQDFDSEGFFRISQTATRITNVDGLTGAYLDAMAYGYASISGYTSCPENLQLEFLDRLGYRKEYDSFNIVNTSFLPADSLLGVRYVLSPYRIPGLIEVPELSGHNGKAVYRNPFALPLALLLDEGETGARSAAKDPFSFTEELYGRLLGSEAGLFTEAAAEKTYTKGRTEWHLKVPDGNVCLYGNLPWKGQTSYSDPLWWDQARQQGRLTAAAGWAYGYGGWLSPSVFYIPVSEGAADARITLETEGEPELAGEQFYALDLDRLHRVSSQIRERAAAVSALAVENGRIACTVHAREGQKLLLAVPASDGWTAVRNGQNTEIGTFEGCFMEIPLVQGENRITIRYSTPGLRTGTALTIAGISGCIGLILIEKKRQRKRGQNR